MIARSKARSNWISIGGADQDPAGGAAPLGFLFGGIETAPGPDEGKVLRSGTLVREEPPLLGPAPLATSQAELLAGGTALRLSGSELEPLRTSTAAVSPDIYLRNPALLRQFLLRIAEVGNANNRLDFEVTDATFDDQAQSLVLHAANDATTLAEFAGSLSAAEYVLIPRFFRVVTEGIADRLPLESHVRITFEGAGSDAFGNPDEELLLVEKTADLSRFNALAPGELKFFRFEVEFDLAADGAEIGPGTTPVALEFLRLPFRF